MYINNTRGVGGRAWSRWYRASNSQLCENIDERGGVMMGWGSCRVDLESPNKRFPSETADPGMDRDRFSGLGPVGM